MTSKAVYPLLLFAAVLLASPVLAPAADAEFVAPRQPETPGADERAFEPRRPSPLLGIFTQFFRSRQPLQMINPAAPAYYGSGEQNVVQNEDADVRGASSPLLIFFGFEW